MCIYSSEESLLFARGQERIKFFCAKVNSGNSSISLSASCRRILDQLAAGQKQINLTRKRGTVFTGNHAATTETKRSEGSRRFLSAKEFVANAPSGAHTHGRAGQAAGPDKPFGFGKRRNRIQWDTIVIYFSRRVLACSGPGPTWVHVVAIIYKISINGAPCWALTRPVSCRCAIRNGGPLFHEQQVRRTWRLANDADSQPTCNPSCVLLHWWRKT